MPLRSRWNLNDQKVIDMSRTGWNRRAAGWPSRLGWVAVVAVTGLGSGSPVQGQFPPTIVTAPGNAGVAAPVAPEMPIGLEPGPMVGPSTAPAPLLVVPDDVQVVRFQGPIGVKVEVLGPPPEAVPPGDGKGLATVGLKVGVGYSLRVSNLPDRPGVELYPMVEILGHLHRPAGVDPSKYPIRILFREADLADAADRGQLVTQVIYLEDPELAVPLKLGKDEPPVVTISPAEDPYKVARALGRVMAVVRIGGRQPSVEELQGPSGVAGIPGGPCPYLCADGSACRMPCGPVCSPPPKARTKPRDEFLCDGGDFNEPLHYGGNGGLLGIDPRDSLVNFEADGRPRVLPTNVICVFAPRFASIRVAVGASEALGAATALMNERLERQELAAANQGPKKLALAQSSETGRIKSKASGLSSRVFTSESSEVRILSGFDAPTVITTDKLIQSVDRKIQTQTAGLMKIKTKAEGIKSAEGPVVTGIVAGPGQMVMTWPPREVAGVEIPPRKPGLAVVKLVSAEEAEPGDTLTYTIKYRNMGNVPIRAVTIIDSLLPRLEYVASSAQGPAGTIFTYGENKAGSLELRWDLPNAVAPGTEGAVTFQAVVR